MIPHPTTEVLLARHGNTPAGRAAAREALTAAIRADGAAYLDELARAAGRSMRCRTADHHRIVGGRLDGCGNDGSTCICECHDGTDPQEGPQP